MSFQIALSALQSITTQLDNISNNIANTGTTGYKSSRTNFSAMYASQAPNGVEAASTTQTLGINGGLLSTGRGLDVAINGNGYLVVKDSTGMTSYTRSGVLDIDGEGNVVDHLGRRLQGYSIDSGSEALGVFGGLNVPTGQIPAQATQSVNFVGNLSADWGVPAASFDPSNAQSYNSSSVSVVYDSLGQQHTVTQYFVKTASNQVAVHYNNNGSPITDDQQQPITATLGFGTNGQVISGSTPTLAWTPNGAEPLSLAFNYAGTTQFAGDTSTTLNTADGYASGTMVNVQIGEDGSLNVQYSNGMQQKVGRLALASFRSESGLVAVDGTSWQASVGSGAALIGTPGTGQFGSLSSQQLEQSNVEVATELVDLMSAQRNYQANTKSISTQNEVLQSLMQVM